jgi:integral membrane protein (TIGR01906 family)
MNILKVLRVIGYILIVLSIPVFLLSGSLAWGFNSHWLYNYGFEKYDVSATTGLPVSELHKTTDALIKYFNSKDDLVQVNVTADGRTFTLFTEEEQLHFKDVKALVRLDYWFFYISLAIWVIISFLMVIGDLKNFWRGPVKAFLWGNILTIILVIGLGVASFFNFDNLFLRFHQLVFTNDYWSSEGYMLQLFPGDFWYDAAYICIAFMAGIAVVWGIISFVVLKLDDRARNRTH